jgi:hypothetical protein
MKLQSIVLTLLKKESESCEQGIFSRSVNEKVIQPYFGIGRDVVRHDDEHGLQMLRSVPGSVQFTCR